MVSDFLKYIENEKRYSNHTLVSYRTDLAQFSDFILHEFQLDAPQDASFRMIRSWIVNLAENKIVPKSINRKIASLRSYYKYLLRNGIIAKNPMLKVTAPKVKKSLPVFVSEENLSTLLDGNLRLPNNDELVEHTAFDENSFSNKRDALIIELFYGTGIRLSELIETKNSNINFYENTLKVLGKETRKGLCH